MDDISWSELDDALNTLCILEDDLLLTDYEQNAMDIAIMCVCHVMNSKKDGKIIDLD